MISPGRLKTGHTTSSLSREGVGIAPGKGCEGVSFFFDRVGNLIAPLTMAISGLVKGELPWAPPMTAQNEFNDLPVTR
jgi:hypothetical protein